MENIMKAKNIAKIAFIGRGNSIPMFLTASIFRKTKYD